MIVDLIHLQHPLRHSSFSYEYKNHIVSKRYDNRTTFEPSQSFQSPESSSSSTSKSEKQKSRTYPLVSLKKDIFTPIETYERNRPIQRMYTLFLDAQILTRRKRRRKRSPERVNERFDFVGRVCALEAVVNEVQVRTKVQVTIPLHPLGKKGRADQRICRPVIFDARFDSACHGESECEEHSYLVCICFLPNLSLGIRDFFQRVTVSFACNEIKQHKRENSVKNGESFLTSLVTPLLRTCRRSG